MKRTIQLSSDIGQGCDHCGHTMTSGWPDQNGDMGADIDHYVNEHGYRLLHVGQETSNGRDGKPWHKTVAILEHDNPPALNPPVQIHIGGLPVPGFKE